MPSNFPQEFAAVKQRAIAGWKKMSRSSLMAAVCLAMGALPTAQAQTAQASAWPTRPITVVVPYPPGGAMDIVGRLVADRLSKQLGQPTVVDNKAGAGGVLGSTQVMRSNPDGYTLLFSNSGALVVQSVLKSPPPFDPVTAFTAITKLADGPNFIGINASVPAQNMQELLALAKKQPGKLSYATPGVGSFGNFVGEYLKLMSGTDILHVPMRGGASSATEVLAGRIQIMIDPSALQYQADGKIRVIATTNGTRVEGYPNIPTVKESGGPDFQLVGWFGLLARPICPKRSWTRSMA